MKARPLRHTVWSMNLICLLAVSVAGYRVGTFKEAPTDQFDAEVYALSDAPRPSDYDPRTIASQYDRPLDTAPPPPVVQEQAAPLAPPPRLSLVALSTAEEPATRPDLAIVQLANSTQTLLAVGDEISEGAERWRVAKVEVVTQGELQVGVLRLETETRTQAYQVVLPQHDG